MPYIGNPIYQSAFVTDTFSGNGTTTAFTMSVAPAGTTNVLVAISGVLQDPSTYGVVGTTITFSSAPPSGTGNISCRYLGIPVTGVTTTAYRTVTEFTATAGQTTFTPPSYTVGFINVYRNGVLLGSADYTATNGTTVVLASGATSGDLVTVESFLVSSVLNAIPNTAGSVSTSNLVDGSVTTAKLATQTSIPMTYGSLGSGNASIMKNRIINGAMVVDQRNGGASVSTSSDFGYSLDRWMDRASAASKYTVQQNAGSVTPPAGFTNYLGVTSTSAYSVSSTDFLAIEQRIEGYNVADLDFGKSTAKTITVSFWVRSSLTGTFGGSLRNNASDYTYVFSYTISSANTWEYKTITITGATSGTWLTTNGIGFILSLNLGVGSTYTGASGAWSASAIYNPTGATSVVGTNGATWYITGVQLEVGSSATGFEYRMFGTEFQLCQRYAYKINSATSSGNYMRYGAGAAYATGAGDSIVSFPTTMRTYPSLTTTTASLYALYAGGSIIPCTALGIDAASATPYIVNIICNVASGLTAGTTYELISNNNQTSYLLFSAEL